MAGCDGAGGAGPQQRGLAVGIWCDAAIARIETLNPELNAVIHELFERGSQRGLRCAPRRPVPGCAIPVKDLGAELAGTPLCEGLAFARRLPLDHHANADAALHRCRVRHLRPRPTRPSSAFCPRPSPTVSGRRATHGTRGIRRAGPPAAPPQRVASGMVPVAHANDGAAPSGFPRRAAGLGGTEADAGAQFGRPPPTAT